MPVVRTHRSPGVIYTVLDEITGELQVVFGFKDGIPTMVTGIDLLINNIIIRLYTEINSNSYEDSVGGSLYSLLGKGYTVGNEDLVRDDFYKIFSQIESQIKDEQELDSTLPLSEKLDHIELESVEYSDLDYSWDVKITIYNEVGSSIKIKLK